MDSADRLDFAPPPQPAAFRAFVLAVLAHILLLLALTWGINWKRDSEDVAAEAELWSSVPQPSVPQAVQPAPRPPTPPVVVAPPLPPPVAVPKAPDIALEQEKKRLEVVRRKQEELDRQKQVETRKQREELERQKQADARKKQEAQKREQLAEQKAADERKQRELQAKAAKDKAREQTSAKAAEAMRQDNLRRMRTLAGTAGGQSEAAGAGTGPSAGYAARIAARIRPYIRHPQDVPGNPPVEIEVRTSPDGTIVSQRVVKSSGNSAWDESAIRAIVATGSLPRDTDGRVHSPIVVSVRQRD